MRAVVVASGELAPSDAAVLAGADLVVAADGGARRVADLGVMPGLVVGDFDSIEPTEIERLVAAGVPAERVSSDKDASDAELALLAALDRGADSTVLLGALGGRLDHALANVLLIANPAFRGREVGLVHGGTTLRALHGGEEVRLDAGAGDLVTLLPLGGDARGVTTRGLRWALAGDTLRFGRSVGLSNQVTAPPASVRLDEGVLLVVVTRSEGGDG